VLDIFIIVSLILAGFFSAATMVLVVFGSSDRVVGMTKLMYRRQVDRADTEIKDMFITASPGTFFWGNVAVFVLVTGLVELVVGSFLITSAVGASLLFIPGIFWTRMRKKRFKKIEEQLPDAFMMIASSLQSGASIAVALQTVAKQTAVPFGDELSLLVRKTQVGVSLDDALIGMEERVPIDSVIMASSAIRISREVGGNLIETISGMAETLRIKFTMEGKIESLTAQGKTQGIFMSCLPLLVGVGLYFIDPTSMSKLVSTTAGYVVLTIMAIMQAAGYIFIRKITNIDS
tara:strand:+ start:198 stop:1067 length:870 start_codon:yes stop_codon:yes gene_type:complete